MSRFTLPVFKSEASSVNVNWSGLAEEPCTEVKNLIMTAHLYTFARLQQLFPGWFSPEPQPLCFPKSVYLHFLREWDIETTGYTVENLKNLKIDPLDVPIVGELLEALGISYETISQDENPKLFAELAAQLPGQRKEFGLTVKYKGADHLATYLHFTDGNIDSGEVYTDDISRAQNGCIDLVEKKYFNLDG